MVMYAIEVLQKEKESLAFRIVNDRNILDGKSKTQSFDTPEKKERAKNRIVENGERVADIEQAVKILVECDGAVI